MTRKWKTEDTMRLLALRKQGETLARISADIGFSVSTIKKRLAEIEDKDVQTFGKSRDEIVPFLRSGGMSSRNISLLTGISLRRVHAEVSALEQSRASLSREDKWRTTYQEAQEPTAWSTTPLSRVTTCTPSPGTTSIRAIPV